MSSRDKLLRLIGQSSTPLPGPVAAKRLGLSRASIWKQVQALRAVGFPLVSDSRHGYRFSSPFDLSLLDLRGSKSRLAKLGLSIKSYHYSFKVSSTQDLAKAAAEKGVPEKHLWVAETQNAGRGRLGRLWVSSAGGLWASLLLRPPLPPAQLPSLTQVAALRWVKTIQKVCGLKAYLKWPNDIVLKTPQGWRKVVGLLTEMSGEMDRTRWLVLGMGINVNNPMPPALSGIGDSLFSQTGRLLARAELLGGFLKGFFQDYQRFMKSGFAPFRPDYWSRYSRPNEQVRLKTALGVLEGRARGVDARGALLVESGTQIESIWEGEIIS